MWRARRATAGAVRLDLDDAVSLTSQGADAVELHGQEPCQNRLLGRRDATHHSMPATNSWPSAEPLLVADSLAGTRLTSYLGVVLDEPVIAPSARKHGLREEEILHAYHNPIRIWDLGDGFTMMIGPNAAAIILEVGYIDGATAVVIVHAMHAREKFLR
jgi:hypothetical protein